MNLKALSHVRKLTEHADMTCRDRLFQVQAAETGKARSPMVDSHVQQTHSDSQEAAQMHHWASYRPCTRAHQATNM